MTRTLKIVAFLSNRINVIIVLNIIGTITLFLPILIFAVCNVIGLWLLVLELRDRKKNKEITKLEAGKVE